MSWKRPPDAIVGYRITVVPTNGEFNKILLFVFFPKLEYNFTCIQVRYENSDWHISEDWVAAKGIHKGAVTVPK